MIFVELRISKAPVKKTMTKTSWDINFLTSFIPFNPCSIQYECHQRLLEAANRLFLSVLLRNKGKHRHKDQLKGCEKIQNV